MKRLSRAPMLCAIAACALALATIQPVQAAGTVPTDVIESAIDVLQHQGDPAALTKAGKPRVKALEAILGEDISAAERDAAWKLYKTPKVEAIAVDTSQLEERISKLQKEVSDYRGHANDLREELRTARGATATAEADARAAWGAAKAAEEKHKAFNDVAEANWKASAKKLEDVKRLHDEAEAREAGTGNPANRPCTAAIVAVLNSETTAFGNLKASAGDLGRLEAHCLQ